MQVRQGFVSNSSTTSFLVAVKVPKEDDPKYQAWQPLYEAFKAFEKDGGDKVQTVEKMRGELRSGICWRKKDILKTQSNIKKIQALTEKIGVKDAQALIRAVKGTYGIDKTLPEIIASMNKRISEYQVQIGEGEKQLDLVANLDKDELVYHLDESYHGDQPLTKIAEALVKCGLATAIDMHQT